MQIKLLIRTMLLNSDFRKSEFTGLERDPQKKWFKEIRQYKTFITSQFARYSKPAIPTGRKKKLQEAIRSITPTEPGQNTTTKVQGWTRTV